MGPPTPSSSSLLRLSIAYFGFLQPPTSSSLRFPVIVPTQLPVSSSGRSTHPAVRQLIRSQYPHHLFVSFSGRNTHNGSISPHRLSAAKIPLCAAPIRFPVPSLRLSAARTGSSSLYPALSGPTRLSVASTWLSAAHIRLSAASSLFNLTLEGVRMQAKDIVYWLHKTIGWRCNDWGFIDVDVGGQKGCTITAKLETAEDSVRAIRARIFPTSSCAVLSRTRLPSQNASSRSSS
ncbi:hypothetical protein CF328_g6944 [Tilletia controversa]|nr:hypothetical protein CF328_g6944 [Tilletia controversa]